MVLEETIMYSWNARIRYSEVDCENKLTIGRLLDYFQDCSTFQSEELGLGVKYLQEKHRVWLLSSWQIDVERYPEIGERVEVGTLPYDFKGFIGYRNFWMKDERGERLAAANSIWTLFDMEKGKPAMPDQKTREGYQISPKIEMEYLPRKIAVPGDGEVMPEFPVTRHYLDTNRHVNNGQYVKVALEYPEEGFVVRRLRAEYKKQAYLNDIFCPVVYKKDNVYVVSLKDKNGEPYAVVELTGEKKQG